MDTFLAMKLTRHQYLHAHTEGVKFFMTIVTFCHTQQQSLNHLYDEV